LNSNALPVRFREMAETRFTAKMRRPLVDTLLSA
jgi:hypothetical protein